MIEPLIQSRDLADSLNDASIDRLMAIDLHWNIISWNKMSEKCTGITRDQLLGKNIFEVFPEIKIDTEMMEAFEYAMKGKQSFLSTAPGRFNRSYYENHFIPLEDKNGNLIGVMNIMHDVAHRIKAEKKLEELNQASKHNYELLQKANGDLGIFTAITGSELKTPIKYLYTTLEMIVTKDGQKLSDSSKAGLRRMQSSLNRINLLLDDILALSAASNLSHEFVCVSMDDVLQSVFALLSPKIFEKEAVINVSPLPSVYGSREMLQKMLYNILDNSLKFHENGAVPEVSIKGNIIPGDEKKQQMVCISIQDNGIGFNQEDGERAFRMFERLNDKKQYTGSGVGLTLSRKIAEAHHGYLTATSKPGKGTTISCYLPVSPPNGTDS
jgi:PAS domain S-box-containing protein